MSGVSNPPSDWNRANPLSYCLSPADLDNDGFIPAEDLAKTQSVERKMVDDVLDDAGVHHSLEKKSCFLSMPPSCANVIDQSNAFMEPKYGCSMFGLKGQ
eukprot:136727-Pelagomonas_calceolata.AAC.2